jgi:uncharacterized metal-binding protein
MNFKEHLNGGIAMGSAISIIIGDPILLFITIFFALLPDIDIKVSKPNQMFSNRFFNYILFNILHVRHRGFFHSKIFGMILFSFGFLTFNIYIAFAILMGYLTHLRLDEII